MGRGSEPSEPDRMLPLPQSLREWLPADDLGWFISGIVAATLDPLGLAAFEDVRGGDVRSGAGGADEAPSPRPPRTLRTRRRRRRSECGVARG
ncbi:MAG TPA: hypothetical protein PKC43_07135 [Phycisphaerales bacterium]|nr:hypothetical protein [Phycisphaerales bacterium]HMP37208.1 hypothetical protein [Phycisphaerales bacterium]